MCIKNPRILTICIKKPPNINNSCEKLPHTNNSHKNHHILTIRMKSHYTNITRINIFVVINQINKHKAKIYNHCMYTQIIIKITFFSLRHLRMIGNKINFVDKKIKKATSRITKNI